jgi:membrane-bound lytic murein transglycosylase D
MRAIRVSCLNFIVILVASGLAGCVSPRAEHFRTSFLPPAPKAPEAVWVEPPEIPLTHSYDRETPSILVPKLDTPARPTRYDARIRKAEEHFETGKRLYKAGDREGARMEFDAAIDFLLASPESVAGRLTLNKRFEDLIDQIYKYDIEGLGAGGDQREYGYDKAPLDDIIEMTFPIDPRMKNKIQDELAATTSQLPLTVNDDVLRFVNYFSSERGKRVITFGLRRAGRFKPMIQRILDEEGVPQELIYLAQAESGFMPRALSRKAAAGMWQFVQFRGREYGLNQTQYIDERLDPEKATRAAARHLRDLYNQMGDWYLALAAYNCGPGCVDRAVQRTGYADFWDLRARGVLPLETTNYVPIILAMTIMSKNAKDYGLENLDLDPAAEYETVKFPSNTNLELIASAADRPVLELRELNPSLLKNIAPADYAVHIPKGTGPAVMAAVETVPVEKRDSWRVHRVQEGESVAQIAKRYNCTASALATANGGSELIELDAGDLLVIPVAPARPKVVAKKAPAKSTTRTGAKSGTKARSTASTKKPAAKPAAYKHASARPKTAVR